MFTTTKNENSRKSCAGSADDSFEQADADQIGRQVQRVLPYRRAAEWQQESLILFQWLAFVSAHTMKRDEPRSSKDSCPLRTKSSRSPFKQPALIIAAPGIWTQNSKTNSPINITIAQFNNCNSKCSQLSRGRADEQNNNDVGEGRETRAARPDHHHHWPPLPLPMPMPSPVHWPVRRSCAVQPLN